MKTALRRTRARLATLALLLSISAVAGAQAGHAEPTGDVSLTEFVPGASRLEGRLLSPCCWEANGRQTLDVHNSPVANELRHEIRRRLKAGETETAIEADLVRRYTTRILATPPTNPLPNMGTVLSVGLLVAGALAFRMIRRWKQSSEAGRKPAPAGGPAVPDEWDRRLDAELEDRD